MAGKDNFFKARMTDEQAQTLESIVKEIQANTPEANVTASSIARYALEKYIDDYRAKENGTAIIDKISIEELSHVDVRELSDKLLALTEEFKRLGKGNLAKTLDRFNLLLLKADIARM